MMYHVKKIKLKSFRYITHCVFGGKAYNFTNQPIVFFNQSLRQVKY